MIQHFKERWFLGAYARASFDNFDERNSVAQNLNISVKMARQYDICHDAWPVKLNLSKMANIIVPGPWEIEILQKKLVT